MNGFIACDISKFFVILCNCLKPKLQSQVFAYTASHKLRCNVHTRIRQAHDTPQKLMVTTLVHTNYGLHRCEYDTQ